MTKPTFIRIGNQLINPYYVRGLSEGGQMTDVIESDGSIGEPQEIKGTFIRFAGTNERLFVEYLTANEVARALGTYKEGITKLEDRHEKL